MEFYRALLSLLSSPIVYTASQAAVEQGWGGLMNAGMSSSFLAFLFSPPVRESLSEVRDSLSCTKAYFQKV